MKIATLNYTSFSDSVLEKPLSMKTKRAMIQEVIVPEPAISDEQIEQIKREAYQAGFQQGAQEERQKIDYATQSAEEAKLLVMQSIASGLSTMSGQYVQNLQNVYNIVPELVMGLSRKVVGQELKHAPLPSIKQTVQQCLARLMHQPHIAVYVSPELVQDLETELTRVAKEENFTGKIEVEADESLAIHDCRIEWKNGLIERNVNEMLTQIEMFLKQQRDVIRSNYAIKTYDELKETIE